MIGSKTERPFRGDLVWEATAVTDKGTLITDAAIRNDELVRARHALAYLKRQLGDDGMLELLADDLATTTERVRDWVDISGGAWRTRWVKIIVPGPNARAFHHWYASLIAGRREADLRAGHPEHFVSHPLGERLEVVENIGETSLPWRISYQPLPDGEEFPEPWLNEYPVRFGSEIVDRGGMRVGYTLHQLRDAPDGMHMRLTTYLPAAIPEEVAERNLKHFCIEFRNWTQLAWLEGELSVSDDRSVVDAWLQAIQA